MIRKLLATTAIATLVATGSAMAQTAPAPAPAAPMEAAPAPQVKQAEGHLASNIIGETVYNGTTDEAENIGSVNDLVIAPDGSVEAIIVGVGGFLGIGQKNVALEYDLIQWSETDGDEFLVVETTREALEAQPDFDMNAYQFQSADAEVGNTKPATADDLAAAPVAGDDAEAADDMAAAPAAPVETAPADETAAAPADTAAPADNMAAAPADDTATATDGTQTSAIDRSTLTDVDEAGIRAEDFVGTTVYGANDENVGEIGDVVLSQDGNVEAVIIDVGGFLGMGEKEVAVGMENLAFLADEDGDMYLYTSFTKEQLEAQAEYDASTFADARNDQLLIVPAQ